MPNSTVYEKRNVLPGGGGSFPFIKPPTEPDPLPVQPVVQTNAAMQPASVKGLSTADPNQMTPNITSDAGTQTVRPYAPRQPMDSMPSVAQQDKPMQPVQRANYWSPTKTPASFSLSTPTPTTKPTSTYTPSASNPTQSVLDYMLAPSKEEQKLYRDNESKKRLLVLADALRHIGNIYNTTRGATPQQFNSPVAQQEQLYQQKKNELRSQRAAALKNAMDQAKLNADQSYKNSMLGMRQAELERGLANDRFNQQLNLGKFAYNQEKDKNDWALKLAAQQETARHNKTSEALRRQGNAISAMNARTSRDRLDYEKSKGLNLSKNYDQVQHFVKGKKLYLPKEMLNTSYGYSEIKKFYDYLSTLKVGKTKNGDKYAITPVKPTTDLHGNPQQLSAKQMLRAIQEASPTVMYMDWMKAHGAVDPDDIEYTSKREIRQRKQAEANKPKNKYKKYKVNNW